MTQKKAELKVVDRPEISETFADSVGIVMFDGQSFRLDLNVTRFSAKEGQPPVGKKYTACRVVLTPKAATDVYNQLDRLMGLLEQQGVVHKDQPPITPTTQH